MRGVYLEHSGEDRRLRTCKKVELVIRYLTLYNELLNAEN